MHFLEMQDFKKMWRFIAGAKCPKCGQIDTIQILRSEIKSLSRCVSCDYADELSHEVKQENGSGIIEIKQL